MSWQMCQVLLMMLSVISLMLSAFYQGRCSAMAELGRSVSAWKSALTEIFTILALLGCMLAFGTAWCASLDELHPPAQVQPQVP